MKKLGLWMMAAILLCGSVVTFVACRGNHLEDIIGNVDNGYTGDKTAVLIKAIQDAAKVKIDYKWAGADKSIEFQYDADEGKFSITGDAPLGHIKYDLRYDENTKKVIFTAIDIYIDGGSVIGCRPYFAIIFNVSDDKYSVVNYVEGYDFEKVYINNEDVTNVLTNACPNKVNMETSTNPGTVLFHVNYAEGETWADIYERYKDADVYEAYSVFNGGGDDASVTLMYLGTAYNGGTNYDLLYDNYNDNPTNASVKYGHKVGQYSDGSATGTYVMKNPT